MGVFLLAILLQEMAAQGLCPFLTRAICFLAVELFQLLMRLGF